MTRNRWSNWSGSVEATPAVVDAPRDLDALSALVRDAASVRPVGAGHSFMPLCATDGTLVSLHALGGTLHVAPDRTRARVPAGWSLKRLTAALWEQGLALANQGDVNPQSVAGSMATGTHGTGRALGSLSTFATGFRLMTADGSLTWCARDANAELFEAQRLSLGLLGVATEIELEVVPAFYLSERIEKRPWAEIRECFDALVEQHRHAEFFLFPHADHVILKTLDPTEPCDPPRTASDHSERAFARVLRAGAIAPFLVPMLQRGMMKGPMRGRRRGPAHTIFPSERTLRFEEMEYEMPRAVGIETLNEAMTWIRRKRLPVAFPFEFRIVAADDIWLSPMNAGPVAAISIHQDHRMPWRKLFADAEAIFRAAGGRPHWAKRHTLSREDVDALYPMAQRFRAVRRAVDPSGKFLNPELERLFG